MERLKKYFSGFIVMYFCVHSCTTVMADSITGIDNTTTLPFWEWSNKEVSIRLVQQLPYQIKNYFVKKGFSMESADDISLSCVFQVVFRNAFTSNDGAVVENDIRDWKIQYQGESMPMKSRKAWFEEWKLKKISESALLAFEWAFFPDKQRFSPREYNWGMVTYNVPPGSMFDLELVWKQDNVMKNAIIHNVECASDVRQEPELTESE